MSDALRLSSLTKVFPRKEAVTNLSFSVAEGEFKALLGPNGSGKSTTLKMCCNLLSPSSGTVEIEGIDVSEDPVGALSRMGCVIETPALYRDRTVGRSLRYICSLRGMGAEESASETLRILERVGMSESAETRFGRLSKGMKQRLVLAQALIGNPGILILDEPTSGLDPVGVRELESLITGLNSEGMSILMSSHMLHEVARTCGRYVFIRNGRLVSEGDVKDRLEGGGSTASFSRPLRAEEASALRAIDGVESVTSDSVRLGPGDRSFRAGVLREMVMAGIPVCSLRADDGLEDLFADMEG